MHALVRLPLAFVALQVGYSSLVWACSCAEDSFKVDPANATADVDLIFVAEVEKVGRARGGCGGTVGSADPRTITFVVTQAIKGVEVGEEFDLDSARDGASCGIDAEEGQQWLLGIQDGDTTYSLCDHGGRLDEGYEEVIDELVAAVEAE